EHRRELGLVCELGVHALDRDGAREAERAREAPEVNRSHAAGRELPVQRVSPDEPLLAARCAHSKSMTERRTPATRQTREKRGDSARKESSAAGLAVRA